MNQLNFALKISVRNVV